MINNYNTSRYGTSLNFLSNFLKLPSLRKYYCQKVGSGDDDTDQDLEQLKTASSLLTHLEVWESKSSTANGTNLLRACRDFKTFVYELGWGHISYCK